MRTIEYNAGKWHLTKKGAKRIMQKLNSEQESQDLCLFWGFCAFQRSGKEGAVGEEREAYQNKIS